MTTLSTLIGPAGTPLGLGELSTHNKPSLWQRVGGVFRRRRDGRGETTAAATANERAASDAAAIEALKQVISDDEAAAFVSDLGHTSQSYDDGTLSDSVDEARLDHNGPSLPQPPRRRLLWGGKDRKDAALDEVRNGIGALASLLTGIQSHMEQQGSQQQQLIACLSHLPVASAAQTESLQALRDQIAASASAHVESLAGLREQLAAGASTQDENLKAMRQQMSEGAKAQVESLLAVRDQLSNAASSQAENLLSLREQLAASSGTQNTSLQAIRDQIAQGSAAQVRLCDALERLGSLQEGTGEALNSIGRRIDQMDARDAAFTSSMEKVSDAMQTVSRASETGAIVLERVERSIAGRDEGVNKTLEKQQGKFTALMAIAIAVSAAAMATVVGVAYLAMNKVH